MKFECVINKDELIDADLTEEDLNVLNGLAGFTLMQSLSDTRLTKVARELTSLAKSENFIASQKKAAWKILGQ